MDTYADCKRHAQSVADVLGQATAIINSTSGGFIAIVADYIPDLLAPNVCEIISPSRED